MARSQKIKRGYKIKKLSLLLLVPLFLTSLERQEIAVRVYKTMNKEAVCIVQNATTAYNPIFFEALNVIREWTNGKYTFVLMTIVNFGTDITEWDDDVDAIILELKGDKEIKSVDFMPDLKEAEADNFYSCYRMFLGAEMLIDTYTTGVKYIGFEEGFIWKDVQKIHIQWREKELEMEICKRGDEEKYFLY